MVSDEMVELSHQEHGSVQTENVPPAVGNAGKSSRAALHPLARLISRQINPRLLAFALNPHQGFFAVLYHYGRRSGRRYANPVNARPTADGFMIPLTFGEGADWFKNVQAAGGGVLRWKGTEFPVVDPVLVDQAEGVRAFGVVERALIPLIGIKHFVRVRHA